MERNDDIFFKLFNRMSESLINVMHSFEAFQKALHSSVPNNYLKMHGHGVRRNRALKTFERRHRSE